jgi:uncharacterized protein YukE
MSALLGADTRRVDLIAEGLRGRSGDIQDLRTMAQRAVAELRNAWAGPDFESIARRWEQEAAPRLTDVSSALSTMASALRAQAEEQRHTSSGTGSPSIPAGPGGTPCGVASGGGVASVAGHRKEIEDLDPDDLDVNGNHFGGSALTFINGHLVGREGNVRIEAGAGVPDPTLSEGVSDNVRLNLARADVGADASLASLKGGDDNARFELSAARVEARAGSSLDIDAHGNLVGSADASAAAYLAYAAGKLHRGSDFANGTLGGKAYVGAEARADASGSVGRDGAKGHLVAEAFAGAKAEVDAGGTLAGVTAETGAEISYGIGAHADVDAELSATGVGVSVDLGATLGLGAGVKLDVSVNPQEVIANVGHAVEDIGEVAEAVGDGVASAVDEVASFLHW